MDFKSAAKLGSLISKEYAEEFIKLLLKYNDISASEAASRLNQHIKTAQDFLDGLAELNIVKKEEVYERKRPYYRYTLIKERISLDIDFASLHDSQDEPVRMKKKIREKVNSGANFTTSGSNPIISSVSIWKGEERSKKERKISLTTNQGRFIYHLPFPNAEFLSISEIMTKAGIEDSLISEILDIVDMLENLGIVETG
jgi:predicted transcriptional regulator